MSVFTDRETLCGNSACPLEAFHRSGPYRMDLTDDSQSHLPAPPREVVEALASVKKFPSENDIRHNFWHVTLLERFEEIHNGWVSVGSANKQPAGRKSKGKKVHNWQAARQNGPKPLIIGKGKEAEVKGTAKPVAEAGKGGEKASSTLTSTPASSIVEDVLSPKGKKLDWAEDA
ncbi:MAG: hypothetical protein LQ346_008701 [Caloplaca aetnensis]|nr:MAG: hypothetical protein LQ346_008701 [Caloplaca aetnensis]